MNKLKKLILGSLLIIALLLAITIILIGFLINPNDYKDKLTRIASSQLHREITIEGNLEWSLFPLGISINQLKIANDPKFNDKYILETEEATLSAKLLPLLYKKFDLKSIYIKNPTINLAKDANNYTNWQSMLQAESAKNSGTNNVSTQENNSPVKKDSSLPDIFIDKINITEATVVWAQPNEKIKIEHLNFTASNFSFGNDTPFNIQGSYKAKSKVAQMRLFNEFDITVTLKNAFENIKLKINKVTLELGGKNYPKLPFLSIDGTVSADLKNNFFRLENFNANLNNIKMTGDISGSLDYKNPSLNGELNITSGDFHDFLHRLNFEASNNYRNISGNIKFKTKQKIITIDPINLLLDKDNINGAVTINAANLPYKITSNLNSNSLNIDKLITKKIPAMKDGKYSRLKRKAQQTEASDSATSQDQQASNDIDDENDEMDTAPDFSDATSSVENVDPNLLPAALREALKLIELTSSSNIKKLTFNNIVFSNISHSTNIKNSIIDTNTKFNIYNSQARLNNKINASKDTLRINNEFNITNIDMQEVLSTQFDVNSLSGTSSLSGNLTSAGNNPSEILNNLAGELKFQLDDGTINGINIDKFLNLFNTKISINPKDLLKSAESILSITESVLSTVTGSTSKTQIMLITATAQIKNGILNNQDLQVLTPMAAVTGAGAINLPNNAIAYKLFIGPKNNPDSISIPVTISGKLDNPSYSVGVPTGSLIKNNLKSITENLEKIPGMDKLPIKELRKLPLEKLDNLLNF